MLREKLYYEDNLPVSIRVCRIDEYPIHFHSDPEIVFLLEGEVTLKNGYYTYHMEANDVFVMNERELHSYSSEDGKNLALLFNFDVKYFARYFPGLENCFLVTDTDNSNDPETEALRDVLFRIMMEYGVGGDGAESRILENTHTLIALLLDKFQFFSMENGRFVNSSGQRHNKILAERMFRIQNYLYANFSKKISLQEIADREHLSIYYLSHIIRAATGLSYKEFLSFIRVEESERLLLGTDMKITHISEAVGFSAVRYYIKYFEKWYGMEPAKYRELYMDSTSDRVVNPVMDIVTHEGVCASVKRLNNEIYREYAVISDATEEEMFVRLTRIKPTASIERIQADAAAIFARLRRSRRPAALLYDMFTELDYPSATAIDHLLSSVMSAKRGAHERTSSSHHAEKAAILIFNEEGELKRLVKVSGVRGKYRMTVLRMTEESIEASLRYSKRRGMPDSHEYIADRIAAYPEVKRSEVVIAESFVFEVTLVGEGSELILFDKISDLQE